MDILDGWHGTLVLLYLGAVALTLKLRPHWLLEPGADPLSLWWRARQRRKAAGADSRSMQHNNNNSEVSHDSGEHQ
ncbi:hypothetical protein WKH50_21270 [Pantoea agglomerans]|uniref:hypothetical protein n=1 Tax=Enterobacter agglomerans TaxID=549 RepID=UPI003C7DA605